jgi:glycosyltransferase involved in cell wall biosynthesis
MVHLHHVNLQRTAGGGEMFTRALTRAFTDAGARVSLYADARNPVWRDLPVLVPTADEAELFARLPRSRSIVVTQSPLSHAAVERLAREHVLVSFAHMPIAQGRSADGFRPCRLVVTVSQYCIGLLRGAGIARLHPEPLYGVADAARGAGPVLARSPYHWDRKKVRDRLFGLLEPLRERFRTNAEFEPRPGLTLGIVSLLSPIKQLPELFALLAPHIARHPRVHLEIFGNGGYAQVRDLRRALARLGERARFWGYQENVGAIYPRLDYLMTGLPEKEALGLNVLEAEACGTPVLAPDAPPFTETMVDGRTGFLYRDPRKDGGAGFAALLGAIAAGKPRPDPREAREHLAKFSYPALVERARRLLAAIETLQ